MALRIESSTAGCRIHIRVQPRASRNEVVGEHDGALKVRLAAPPVAGAANDALIRLLADTLDVPRSTLRIASGGRGRTKVVEVSGLAADEAARRLAI